MLEKFLAPGVAGAWMSDMGFSDAVATPSHIYVAGQVGQLADGTTPATYEEQARLAFRNVKARVLEAGGDPARIVALTILMDQSLMSDRRSANEVLKEAKAAELPECSPATTGLFVSGLAFSRFLVEVQAIVVR